MFLHTIGLSLLSKRKLDDLPGVEVDTGGGLLLRDGGGVEALNLGNHSGRHCFRFYKRRGVGEERGED